MAFELIIENISLSIKRKNGDIQNLFQNFSTHLTNGRRVVITGASGQGKSSLLKIIARLELPSTKDGKLVWNGIEANQIEITKWRTMMHYVAQSAVMIPGTIEDNLKLPSKLHAAEYDQAIARVYMNAVGLEHLDWTSDATSLSGGEKQRIALVRSLLLNPKVLLLDEITASLDEANTLLVEQLLKQWVAQSDRAYIWITHNPEQVDRVSNIRWDFQDHIITVY